jgi:hypothetical protein
MNIAAMAERKIRSCSCEPQMGRALGHALTCRRQCAFVGSLTEARTSGRLAEDLAGGQPLEQRDDALGDYGCDRPVIRIKGE